MSEIYETLWKLSADRQDLRNDYGHAKVVTKFAEELAIKLNADLTIVIPAAILHDTGYFGYSQKTLFDLMSKKLDVQTEKRIKHEHMLRGAEFAKTILTQLKYDPLKIKSITHIILFHDSTEKTMSIEEQIVRDADKLWRYSDKGFWIDVKRRNSKPMNWYTKLLSNLEKKDYFLTTEAKIIAKTQLNLRLEEIRDSIHK
ncbi:MAG: HD domain-containing protein [Candidatus Woesearchaeota archaeon]